jgi:hypothetical protein
MVRSLFVRLSALLLLCSLGTTTSMAETGSAPAAVDTTSKSAVVNHKVIVYYLYFTPRCETCLTMEAFAKEAVETGFANELKQGTVEWHSFDTGKKQYEHFWNEFKLETKSLIIVDTQDGKRVRFKNCEKIWDLVGAKPDFLTYVQSEVRSYLNGDSLETSASQKNP